jgi:transposase-like protein
MGRRDVIGIEVGECETEAFWSEFLPGSSPVTW